MQESRNHYHRTGSLDDLKQFHRDLVLNWSRACSRGSGKHVLVPCGSNAQKQLWLRWSTFTAFTLKTECRRSQLRWHVKPVNHLHEALKVGIARHSKLTRHANDKPWSRITSAMGKKTASDWQVCCASGYERTGGLEAESQRDQCMKLKMKLPKGFSF